MFDATQGSLYAHVYNIAISAVIVLAFCYIAYIDFRTFKIPNRALLLLILLYVLNSVVAGRWTSLLGDSLFAVLVFAICVFFYSKNTLGGGDVKLLPLACLFVGIRGALPFCILLLFFILVHYVALRSGLAQNHPVAGRRMIPYAPSIAGALVGTMCLHYYMTHIA